MSGNGIKNWGCFAFALSMSAVCVARAEESAEPAAAAAAEDPAMVRETDYIEKLIEFGYSDFAEPVIAATKQKWPGSETRVFALEVRMLLMLGRFDEAQKLVAALPDRDSPKFWAARLEIANSYFSQRQKDKCLEIYSEFFKKYPKPTPVLRPFMRQARYQYAQILGMMNRLEEAADNYVQAMDLIDKDRSEEEEYQWCAVGCEAIDLYLRRAAEIDDIKARKPCLDKANPLIKKMLWQQHLQIIFGRAIAMKAHAELLGGSLEAAQTVINDYMEKLSNIHEQLEKWDPDGSKGALRQSPMPQCRYMLAEMMWAEARKELAKKPKRDDNKIKDLMFGAKTKGKRNGQGAYNHALNVFLRYPQSAWAIQAGDLVEEIKSVAQHEYKATVKDKATAEMRERVLQMQFDSAAELFASGKFEEAIKRYYELLAVHPEVAQSVSAIETLATAHNRLMRMTEEPAVRESLRLDLDAIEGYLAERFAGSRSELIMSRAGDAVQRLAAMERTAGENARADALLLEFCTNYKRHLNAPAMCASLAYERQKQALAVELPPGESVEREQAAAEREAGLREAMKIWELLTGSYSNSAYFASALSSAANCCRELGDLDACAAWTKRYIAAELNPMRRMQAQMNLAMIYQRDGFGRIDALSEEGADENADAELKKASVQIIHGIKELRELAKSAKERLGDPAVSVADKKAYLEIHEKAMYAAAECWNRLPRPKARLQWFREQAAAAFEEYLKEYPRGTDSTAGKLARSAYLNLGTVYFKLDKIAEGKDALMRLRKEFPDSNEARHAMPRLARSIIDYAAMVENPVERQKLLDQSTDIYREMIRTSSANYRALDFVNAGEALIRARSWDTAFEAFQKAEQLAGTNRLSVVARARIGLASSSFAQKNYLDAREKLDELLEDERLSRLPIATNALYMVIDVATIQGENERETAARKRHFAAAVGSIKRLRQYLTAVFKREQQNEASAQAPAAEASAGEGEEAEADGQIEVAAAPAGEAAEGESENAPAAGRLKNQWVLDQLDLKFAEVKIRQMQADKKFGNDEAAEAARSAAVMKLITMVQTRTPEAGGTLNEYTVREKANIETIYGRLVPLLNSRGAADAADTLKYAEQYLRYFSEGKHVAEINLCRNEAKARLGAAGQDGDSAAKGEETPAESDDSAAKDEETPAGGEESAAGEEPAAAEAGAEAAAE